MAQQTVYRTLQKLLVGRRAAIRFFQARCFSDNPGKTPVPYDGLPDPIEHATGLERKELLSKLQGDNRYEPKIFKRAESSSEQNPNLVPSHFENRIIGCICHPEQMHIKWMWVRQGHPKRCECGHWFDLIEADPESQNAPLLREGRQEPAIHH